MFFTVYRPSQLLFNVPTPPLHANNANASHYTVNIEWHPPLYKWSCNDSCVDSGLGSRLALYYESQHNLQNPLLQDRPTQNWVFLQKFISATISNRYTSSKEESLVLMSIVCNYHRWAVCPYMALCGMVVSCTIKPEVLPCVHQLCSRVSFTLVLHSGSSPSPSELANYAKDIQSLWNIFI